MSSVFFIKKKKLPNLSKFRIGALCSALIMSGCTSLNYDLNKYDDYVEPENLCVVVNDECRPLLNLKTVGNTMESSISGRYFSDYPYKDDIVIDFDVNGDEGFNILESLKSSSNNYSVEILDRISNVNINQSVDEMRSAHVFRFTYRDEETNTSEQIVGIKFNKDTQDYDDFKVKFSRSRALTENFDLFIALHELFHLDDSMNGEIIPSTHEFFADVTSVVALSVKNNYDYKDFINISKELGDVRKRDAEVRKSYTHYGINQWLSISKILPTEEEYDALKKIHIENSYELMQEVVDSKRNENGLFEINRDYFNDRESVNKLISNIIYKKMEENKLINKPNRLK